jgi:ABC-type transport system involved in cytochrome bd biosynthesis fused ATPase/permease subunit
MSKLDLAKEQIGYLKMWLGIAVAAGLSLIGWTASNFATLAMPFLLALGFIIVLIIAMSYKVHKAIQQKIKRLEKL